MKLFKKKSPKRHKKQIKKSVPTLPKPRPQQWTPPFTRAGERQKIKTFDDTNPIEDAPKLIKVKPTCTLPPHPPEKNESIEQPSEPNSQVSLRDQKARKEFLTTFKKLTYRWRSWDVWTDFITMAACSISNSVDKSHFDVREERYLQTIKKYNKEEQRLFPELFAHLVMALEENQEQDFLGDVYTELGLNSKEHQQIFTPYHVAHFMAKITMDDVEKQIKEKGFVTIHDDCCGGGVTLIAAANVMKEKLAKIDLNFQNHLLVSGQDIDPIVAMMCYIQMSLLGVAGYFKIGNSLTEPMCENDDLENYWFTPMYFFPTWHFRRVFRGVDNLFQAEQTTEV